MRAERVICAWRSRSARTTTQARRPRRDGRRGDWNAEALPYLRFHYAPDVTGCCLPPSKGKRAARAVGVAPWSSAAERGRVTTLGLGSRVRIPPPSRNRVDIALSRESTFRERPRE